MDPQVTWAFYWILTKTSCFDFLDKGFLEVIFFPSVCEQVNFLVNYNCDSSYGAKMDQKWVWSYARDLQAQGAFALRFLKVGYRYFSQETILK